MNSLSYIAGLAGSIATGIGHMNVVEVGKPPDNPTKHLLLEGEYDSVSPSNKR